MAVCAESQHLAASSACPGASSRSSSGSLEAALSGLHREWCMVLMPSQGAARLSQPFEAGKSQLYSSLSSSVSSWCQR